MSAYENNTRIGLYGEILEYMKKYVNKYNINKTFI